ncbi:hypothetical protein QTN93_12365 [Sphingomonas aerolata]|uniref:hypothetical protein n=1 Tax=Sphingomonas aerolata TaxID=185951 RepID=UPI0035A60241
MRSCTGRADRGRTERREHRDPTLPVGRTVGLDVHSDLGVTICSERRANVNGARARVQDGRGEHRRGAGMTGRRAGTVPDGIVGRLRRRGTPVGAVGRGSSDVRIGGGATMVGSGDTHGAGCGRSLPIVPRARRDSGTLQAARFAGRQHPRRIG